MNDIQSQPQDGSQPGVLGDESEAQDLNQPGHPELRVTEADVKAAFDENRSFDEKPELDPDDPTHPQAKFDHLTDKVAPAEDRQETLIDESLDETFPASDPPSAKHIT